MAASLIPEHFTPVLRLDFQALTDLVTRQIGTPPMQDLAGCGALLLRSRVRLVLAASDGDRMVCFLIHDPFDGVGTMTALHAAAEAIVNLAYP